MAQERHPWRRGDLVQVVVPSYLEPCRDFPTDERGNDVEPHSETGNGTNASLSRLFDVESICEMRVPVASPGSKQLMDFFRLVRQLKVRKRTGWGRHNVRDPESIADHMYRMAMMAFVVRQPTLDTNKCIKMALVHDVAESIVGDITPHCGISKEEKHRLESEAMQQIRSTLSQHGAAADEMMELWQEYCASQTPEAKYVKDLDKLEMILQADEYEETQDVDLQQFFDNTRNVFQTETGQGFAENVRSQRAQRLAQKNHTNHQ